MPELPDVETFRRRLEQGGLHRRIARVALRRDDLLVDVARRELERALRGHELHRTFRHGKHLFAGLDAGGWLRLHFGMSGDLRIVPAGADAKVEEPPHTQLRLDFEDGGMLAFVNVRALGEIGLVDDPSAFARERALGPDALGIGLPELVAMLAGSATMVKSALMDQRRIAGIGNLYSDEVLLRAGLHPEIPAADVGPTEVERLHRAMRAVLEEAVEAGAEPDRVPAGFLMTRREAGAPCPRCGTGLRKLAVAGRTSYVCPSCQRR